MPDNGIENGKIKSTHLGPEDHNILTFYLSIESGSGVQSIGGFDISNVKMEIIGLLLDVLDVRSWEELQGHYVRIRRENGLIVAIGHLILDRWFVIADEMKTYEVQDHR